MNKTSQTSPHKNPQIFSPSVFSSQRIKACPRRATFFLLLIFCALFASRAIAEDVNMDIIAQIESGGDPNAYNKNSQARGKYQITPICLKEFNTFHKTKYTLSDLYNTEISEKVACWYLDFMIPCYIKRMGLEKTTQNILIAYHDGIGNLVKYKDGKRKLGKEMTEYLKKYELLQLQTGI